MSAFLIGDLKPAAASKVMNAAALAFKRSGVDPGEILRHPEKFEGELSERDGHPALIFIANHELLYYAHWVRVKDLKRGKKMKGP